MFNYLHHSGLLPNLLFVNNRLAKLNNETKCYYYNDKDANDNSNDSKYLPVICSSSTSLHSDKLILKELSNKQDLITIYYKLIIIFYRSGNLLFIQHQTKYSQNPYATKSIY